MSGQKDLSLVLLFKNLVTQGMILVLATLTRPVAECDDATPVCLMTLASRYHLIPYRTQK